MIPALTCAPFLPGRAPGHPCTGDPDERRIHRHDPEPETVGNPPGVRPRGRSRLCARLCPRPRNGRLRPDPRAASLDRPVGDADDRVRGGRDRAHPLHARASPWLHRADARRAADRDARPVQPRPARRALHLRRLGQRAAARRRFPRSRRTLCAHRRIPGHPAADLDGTAAVRSRRRALPVQAGFLGSEAVPAAACADLLRRCVGRGARGGRQARGRLRAVGRIARPGARPDDARARRSREARPPGALLRVVPPDPRGDRGRSMGARTASSTKRAGCAKRPGSAPAARSRAKARAACSPLPSAARASTSGCGPRSRSSPARARIRRRSSARPNRSPTRCSTTTTSA